jgi:hypothetical protein
MPGGGSSSASGLSSSGRRPARRPARRRRCRPRAARLGDGRGRLLLGLLHGLGCGLGGDGSLGGLRGHCGVLSGRVGRDGGRHGAPSGARLLGPGSPLGRPGYRGLGRTTSTRGGTFRQRVGKRVQHGSLLGQRPQHAAGLRGSDAGGVEGRAQLLEGQRSLGLGARDQRLDDVGGACGGGHVSPGAAGWVMVRSTGATPAPKRRARRAGTAGRPGGAPAGVEQRCRRLARVQRSPGRRNSGSPLRVRSLTALPLLAPAYPDEPGVSPSRGRAAGRRRSPRGARTRAPR